MKQLITHCCSSTYHLEVVQESLGFSPAELVFAHLKLLQEQWLGDFRFKLHHACELAKQKDAKSRNFSPGDSVAGIA